MTIEQAINAALSTDRILSLILVILAIWFTRTAWGDLVGLWKGAQAIKRLQTEADCDREIKRAQADIDTQRQLVQELSTLNQNLTDWFSEIRAVASTQNIQHNILLHILEKIPDVTTEITPPPDTGR